MKKFTLIPLILILCSTFLFSQNFDQEYFRENGEAYFSFYVKGLNLERIGKIISIDNIEDGKAYAYANQRDYRKFKALNIRHEALRRPGLVNYPVKMSSTIEGIREWDSYPTYDAYVEMMYQFASDYPDLCEIVDAGNTIEGRKILFAKISDNIETKEAEPQFMYTSTMHGDETTGYVLMLRLIDHLLSNYGTDQEATMLVDNLEIWINPLANPDGTFAGGNTNINGATRGNANYIDINRNFADPEDGPHPDGNAYQPETIIMMNLANEHNFVMSANFHGGTEVVNYPWDTWPQLHQDDDWFRLISREYADTVHAFSSGYMTGYDNGITNGYQWYEVAGGRQDYYTYFHGGREVTIELSDVKLLNPSQLPAHWTYNKRSLINYIKQSLNGIAGIVSSNTGEPIKAEIRVVDHDADYTTIFSDSLTGRYQRMIYSGTYTLEFSAEDHFTQTIPNIAVANGNYSWLEVELISTFGEPDTVAPVAVNDLAVTDYTSNSISIGWTVPLDESAGGVRGYDIRYSTQPITSEADFENAEMIEFPGMPQATGEYESLSKEGLDVSTPYYFAVKSHDIWSNYSNMSNVADQSTMVAPEISVTPASITNEMNINSTILDTLVIANVSDEESTLDYSAEIADGLLKNSINVKLISVEKKSTLRSKENNNKGGGSSIEGFGGPDDFGYEWIDSDESNGPQFVWEDISTTGTLASNWIPTGTFSATDEGYVGPLDIGFDFEFYGIDYSQVYAGSNGFLSFDQISGSTYTNGPIPSGSTPNNMIAAVWDDLDGGTSGKVYYEQKGNAFVIQYTDWPKYSGSGSFTFQVVLHSNNKITIYYEDMSASTTSATVGIENEDGTIGLQVVEDANYLASNKALRFSSEPEWIVYAGNSGTLYNGNSVNAVMQFTTYDLEPGTYTTNLVVTSNDPANSTIYVPVSLLVGTTGVVSTVVNVNSDWNLVSIPVIAEDMGLSANFPDAISSAFGFDNGYIQSDPLQNGHGYWLKFDQSQNYIIQGQKYIEPIPVQAGWNIIGGNDENFSTANMNSVPSGIIETQFFGYENNYTIADFILPGKGYWVKVSEDGVLVPGVTPKETSELDKENLFSIQIRDANKGNATLFMGDFDYSGNLELPPAPPAGFDARFENNSFAISGMNSSIIVRSDNFPVELTSPAADLIINGSLLKSGEKFVLQGNGMEKINVSLAIVPDEFLLAQNYPNPFNPSTRIKFAVPVDSKVTVTLYNMLGQKVQDIVSQNYSVGLHEVDFNASELSSGMYIYSITAQGVDGSNFVDTKKMMLMK
ncbi:MAG: hypothetical protein SCALA702_36230 [Melioribacteraceae bacterium]|nr:MAG: hypothetical protein SCALA702_36230 [Melioribacteraceae bacterium]